MEIDTVILEDNQEYNIIDTIEINHTKYIYLSLKNNPEDICIRKLTKDEKNIICLDTDEEFEISLKAFKEKYEDIFDNK